MIDPILEKTMNWPYWPLLPLKRKSKDSMPEVGFIVDQQKVVVYLANLFDFLEQKTKLRDLKKIEYHSLEALVIDGWEVD